MRSKSWIPLLIAALAGLALMSGCVRRTAPSTQGPAATDAATSAVAFLDKTFVVAPFTIPATDADLLSGYLPANHTVPELVPARLDAVLEQVLSASSHRFVPAATAMACAKTASRGNESGRLATLKYWQNVGMCAGADYVLVPLALYWRDRDGSEAGTTKPASVDLSLYLIDTRTGGVIKHFHFEETQKALVDNLLEADKFVSRHGRWLTAQELAQEGLTKGVREFGL
jgi:hypothetical protein